jgi:hypothetical protein
MNKSPKMKFVRVERVENVGKLTFVAIVTFDSSEEMRWSYQDILTRAERLCRSSEDYTEEARALGEINAALKSSLKK